MPAVNLSALGGAGWQLSDDNGDPISTPNPPGLGGLFTYLAGTSTLASTYTESTGATANTNPIILANGRPTYLGSIVEIWQPVGTLYKFVLKNNAGTTIWTQDNIPGISSVDITGLRLNSQSGTTYTLVDADSGKFVVFTSATTVVCTIPSGLRTDFFCGIAQLGAGKVTVSAGVGVTLVNADSLFSTQAQYVELLLWARAADSYVLGGRTAA